MYELRYVIAAEVSGTLDEILSNAPPASPPDLDEVLRSLSELAFIVETVAHLQHREAALLPASSRARVLIARLTTSD